MDPNFLNRNNIDENFKSTVDPLISELKTEYSKHELKRLEFNKITQLINDLENFKPKSQVRESKIDLIKYITYFIKTPINDFDDIQISKLQAKYILPTINNHLHKRGYTAKWIWLWGLLFLLPIDIILWLFIGEYYFYIPIVSIPYIFKQVREEIKAKKKNKLW